MLPTENLPSFEDLRGLMSRYQTKNLVKEDAGHFRTRLDDFMALREFESEGYADPKKQRDLSIRFHWGHNHDFGDFFVPGRMGDRHLVLPAIFMDRLNALPRRLEGCRVLDIGCWTGGVSLLLCAMGAEVVAIDEVRKYVECLSYLREAFDIERLNPRRLSLYDLASPEYQDAFDMVVFSGVIYHVTDPVLALRHVFNTLKDGGTCLVETQACDSSQRVAEYWGPTVLGDGSPEELNRSGWNWFVPSEPMLTQMMEDVGFRDVRSTGLIQDRLLTCATRHEHVDMLRAGLSVPDVR